MIIMTIIMTFDLLMTIMKFIQTILFIQQSQTILKIYDYEFDALILSRS